MRCCEEGTGCVQLRSLNVLILNCFHQRDNGTFEVIIIILIVASNLAGNFALFDLLARDV